MDLLSCRVVRAAFVTNANVSSRLELTTAVCVADVYSEWYVAHCRGHVTPSLPMGIQRRERVMPALRSQIPIVLTGSSLSMDQQLCRPRQLQDISSVPSM